MSAKFTTIMYGSLEDLDSILDCEEMDEQELQASIQRVLKEVQAVNARIDKIANLPTVTREKLAKFHE